MFEEDIKYITETMKKEYNTYLNDRSNKNYLELL